MNPLLRDAAEEIAKEVAFEDYLRDWMNGVPARDTALCPDLFVYLLFLAYAVES